jgi:hypothetical protein
MAAAGITGMTFIALPSFFTVGFDLGPIRVDIAIASTVIE